MPNGRTIRISRGFDIKLPGAAVKQCDSLPVSDIVSVKPDNFKLVTPKLEVQVGDEVKAGQTLFHDKLRPELRFTAPVSGEVTEVFRGEKRHILEIRILADKSSSQYIDFGAADPAALDREAVARRLLDSGVWSYIRQRPYDLIANPADTPKAVFVSCFDSAPLAADHSYIIAQEPENFKTGLQALQRFGTLHLGLRDGQEVPAPEGAQTHTFNGPHPAGNVGIQIHHVDPIRKGELVWYVHAQDVLVIGRLFREGRYRAERTVALTGEGFRNPQYIKAVTGQSLDGILASRLNEGHFRLIQGNVLTGQTAGPGDHLSHYTNQITALPEGDRPEFLGWLLPGFNKLSLSRTFFSWLSKNKTYKLDTNLHGEHRAFVVTEQYEQVLPMNILPVFLLKSILARDIERMEQLGIYEVSEEDFALCEFVCTSKMNVQQIISEGLELMRTEA